MFTGHSKRAFRLCLAAIIVWLQAFSLSHAAEHGGELHEHDGVACEFVVLASEQIAILPETAQAFVMLPAADISAPPYAPISSRIWPPERGPPPRSPPTIKQ